MKINPKKLRLDGGTQARVEVKQSTIDEYAESYREGKTLPPPDVFYDGVNYWVADGHQRTLAAIAAGVKKFEVEVHQGEARDAVLFSVGANASHGIRRSNADKRNAVLTLLNDEEWGQWSDGQIAKRCGVSDVTVGRIRAENNSSNVGVSEPRKATRNGKEYTVNTTNIGKSIPTYTTIESEVTETQQARDDGEEIKNDPIESIYDDDEIESEIDDSDDEENESIPALASDPAIVEFIRSMQANGHGLSDVMDAIQWSWQ